MKRVSVFVILFIMCLTLGGCGLSYLNPFNWPSLVEKAAESIQNTSATNSLQDTVAANSVYPQLNSTAKKAQQALKSQSFASQAMNSPWFSPKRWFANIAVANAARASEDYYNAVASDKTLQAAISASEGSTRVKKISVPKVAIIIVAVVLVAIAFLVISKLFKNKPCEEIVVEEGVKSDSQTKELQLRGTDDGQMTLLTRLCSKYQLNVESVLEYFKGDTYAANMYLMAASEQQLIPLR